MSDQNSGTKFNRLLRVPKNIFKIGGVAEKEVPMFSGIKVSRHADKMMRVEATDGRRAIVATWNDAHLLPDDAHETIIPAELAMLADKATPKKGDPDEMLVEVNLSDEHLDFEAKARNGDESVTVAGSSLPLDEFPNIEAVTPTYAKAGAKPGTAARARMSVELLAGLLKSMLAMGCDVMEIEVPTKMGQPVKLSGEVMESGIKVMGLQMPMRSPDEQEEGEKAATEYMEGMTPPPAEAAPEATDDNTQEMFEEAGAEARLTPAPAAADEGR